MSWEVTGHFHHLQMWPVQVPTSARLTLLEEPGPTLVVKVNLTSDQLCGATTAVNVLLSRNRLSGDEVMSITISLVGSDDRTDGLSLCLFVWFTWITAGRQRLIGCTSSALVLRSLDLMNIQLPNTLFPRVVAISDNTLTLVIRPSGTLQFLIACVCLFHFSGSFSSAKMFGRWKFQQSLCQV